MHRTGLEDERIRFWIRTDAPELHSSQPTWLTKHRKVLWQLILSYYASCVWLNCNPAILTGF